MSGPARSTRSRWATRSTWRSTAIAGTPKAAPRTIDAVLRPTPRSRVSDSRSAGTSPPNSASSPWLAARSALAFCRKKPVALMPSSSASGGAAAKSAGVRYFSKRPRVTWLIWSSRACAARIVATILAAQARDDQINQVTRGLFEKYRTPADFAAAPPDALEEGIKATGFFRQKAKALRAASQGLLAEFGGEVPADLESLTRLRGVGRKTASIVLGAAFGVPAIAVDRHVARVAGRLRLSRSADPDRIEEDLRSLYPKNDWVKATWCFVLHGRRVCMPTPACPVCP